MADNASTRQGRSAVTSTRQGRSTVTSTRGPSAVTSTRGPSAVTSTRGPSAVTSTRGPSAVTSPRQRTDADSTQLATDSSHETQQPMQWVKEKDRLDSQSQSADAASLVKLYRMKQRLQTQLQERQATLNTVHVAASPTDKECDLEKILDRVARLQKELQTAAACSSLGDLLTQRLQLSNCLCQGLFPALTLDLPPSQSCSLQPNQHQALRVLVDRQAELNTNICKMHKEILEKKPVLVQLEKRNLELKRENRELMAQLLDGKQHIESSVRQCQHSKVIQRTERKLGEMVVQVNMMQHIFQCLILGSAVDWAADQRLCQLMISLGKPLDMQLCLHDPATLTDVSTHDS